jgi:hypothetical protein
VGRRDADETGARFKGKLGMAVRKTVKLELRGHDRDAVAATLPAPARRLLEERFIATIWYPLEGASELIEGVAHALGEPIDEVARRVGRRVTYENAGSLGRTLISLFGTPERLARYFGPIWAQTYDSGVVDASFDAATRRLRVRVARWDGHHPTICMTVLGTLEALGEGMRSPALRSATRLRCVTHGAPSCEHQLVFAGA